MATYTTNYNLKKPDSSDPFGDFRGDYNDNLDIIDANLGGGGGSGGHTIVDPDGNSLPQEDELQFTGAVSVTDDNVNGRTVVNVSGGSNLILDAKIFSTEEKQVGVWTNQKPLYQKTVYYAGGVNGNITFAHGISDIDEIVSVDGIAKDTDVVGDFIPFARIRSDSLNIGISDVTLTNVIYYVPSQFGGRIIDIYVTMLYTKTTDTAGSGGYEAYGFSPVIYSDVERVIGVWRDNKPLYQRTFVLSSPIYVNGSGTLLPNDIQTALADVEIMVDSECARDSTYSAFISPYVYKSGGQWYILSADSWGNVKFITLRYTKTTDVAGSGDYNTYGVPTVHYDTNEQVVGTWIDGKPLYERTFSLGALPNNSIKTVAHYIANVDLIFIADSFFQTGAGASSYLNFTNDSTTGQVEILVDRTNFEIWAGSNRTSWNGYATVRYTKSTD